MRPSRQQACTAAQCSMSCMRVPRLDACIRALTPALLIPCQACMLGAGFG
jgi:hypothetical protein